MSHNITLECGASVRLPTAGKYCDRDIIITATGTGGKYKTALEYIESTGTQWIDTGLRLNQDSKLEIMISHFDTSVGRKIFGSRTSATENSFGIIYGPVGGVMSIVADFDNYANNRLAYVVDGNEFVEITISNEKLKINDSEKVVSTYGSFTTPENAYLFNCSGSYSSTLVPAGMRLCYCKIYDNGIPVRDFVPVLDWNDVACLYDKVSGELFYNQGTGEFLYEEPNTELTFALEDGTLVSVSDISRIDIPQGEVYVVTRGAEILWQRKTVPIEYREVAYLESTGTQYIDTGYTPTSENFNVVFDFERTESKQKGSLFGSAVAGTQYSIVSYITAPASGDIAFYVGESAALITRSVGLNTRCVLGVRAKNNEFRVSIGGTAETATYKGQILKTYNLYLFGSNRQGEAAYQFSMIKLYACQIYDNDVLVRDFVPCYRKSDNKPGMYDRVTETFFTNAGTGEFLYG